MAPEHLGRLVLSIAPAVSTVDAADGVLVVDELHGRTFPLTASGALLWACLDGASSLDEICGDIAEELDLPYERVAEDAHAFAVELLDRRLATAPGGDRYRRGDPARGCACCAHAHEGADHARDGADDGRWLAEPDNACRDLHFPLGDAGQMTARLVDTRGSEHLVGIRTNEADAADELRARLGPLLSDEPFRFPNIDVRFGPRRGRVRDTHVVFRRSIAALYTFSRERAIEAALAQLPTFLPVPDGVTPLRVRALERNGSAVLVFEDFAAEIDAHHRRLSVAGYSSLPATPVLVDAGTGEALLPRGDDPCAPELARVPISHVLTSAAGSPNLPAPMALAALDFLVSGPGHPLRAASLRALAALASAKPIVPIDRRGPHDVVRALVEL